MLSDRVAEIDITVDLFENRSVHVEIEAAYFIECICEQDQNETK